MKAHTLVRWIACLACVVSPVFVGSAQRPSTCPESEIVGITENWEVHSQTWPTCFTAAQRCNGRVFLPNAPLAPYAGAIAHDVARKSYYTSNGVHLSEVRLDACTWRCQNIAISKLPPCRTDLSQQLAAQIRISGAAVDYRQRRLFLLWTAPYYYWIETYSIQPNCVMKLGSCCEVKFAANPQSIATAGGITYDADRDLLYVALSFSDKSGAHSHEIRVAPARSPCRTLCAHKFVPLQCWPAKRIFTGIALDPCRQVLFVTEGTWTQVLSVVDPAGCRFANITCCRKSRPRDYRGLTVTDRWMSRSCCPGCTTAPCANCAPSRAVFTGNALELHGGPANSVAACIVSYQCRSVPFPAGFMCGNSFCAMPVILMMMAVPAGPGACGASARILVTPPPIPPGVTFTFQWAISCGGGLPMSKSNALQITT